MRRSLAPSQISRQRQSTGSGSSSTRSSLGSSGRRASGVGDQGDGDVVIETMPLFGFLSIPDSIRTTFRVPSGCVITEESIALRKVKTLGYSKNFIPVLPGGPCSILPRGLCRVEPAAEEDGDEEELPSRAALPPYDPLVLWQEEVTEPEHEHEAEEKAGPGPTVEAETDPGASPTERARPRPARRAPHKIEVVPELASKLRPHQRQGVQFLFDCTMGRRSFDGNGCILADDMGLGKTLMSITLLWTLLNQGFRRGEPATKKVMVVCPTSLVGNWENEIMKWVGDRCPVFAVKSEPQKIIRQFVQHYGKGVLIVSYETQRRYVKLFLRGGGKAVGAADSGSGYTPPAPADLLICDEAHKLKNADSGLSIALNSLGVRRRILLSGTPMQNDLIEFFNMVSFCNPGVLGTVAEFRRRYERPILASREPDASESCIARAVKIQADLSAVVNEFILKRGNILNAQHLPPKLVQLVCCRLSPIQAQLYDELIRNKDFRHIRDSRQTNTLNSIRYMINICSHPEMIREAYQEKRRDNDPIDEELQALHDCLLRHEQAHGQGAGGGSTGANAGGIGGMVKKLGAGPVGGGGSRSLRGGGGNVIPRGLGGAAGAAYLNPFDSGKFLVCYRLMATMRVHYPTERIVLVSNYTSTLDLLQRMCAQNNWPVVRLDGSVAASKRTKIVDEFNDPSSGNFCFLLSSKAGGCGINLIGGCRLVMFDPDWNPASDKQAAARIWREGQKRRCFIYRLMSTGTVEEKIIQRQLSKEGLQNIVDDADQVNEFSSAELKAIFVRRDDTISDTHDTLSCRRCSTVSHKGVAERNARLKLGAAQLIECAVFLTQLLDLLLDAVRHASAALVPVLVLMRADQQGSSGDTELDMDAEGDQLVVLDDLAAFRDECRRASELGTDGEQSVLGLGTLPEFSKRLREVVTSLDAEYRARVGAIGGSFHQFYGGGPVADVSAELRAAGTAIKDARAISISGEYMRLWSAAVEHLTAIGKQNPTTTSSGGAPRVDGGVGQSEGGDEGGGNEDEEEEPVEFVEQVGCPEDEDVNNWSHHAHVDTCDDECLRKAMMDDPSFVSFVFGLEINWTLLQSRIQANEEKERQRAEKEAGLLAEKKQAAALAKMTDGAEDENEGKAVDELPEETTTVAKSKDKSKDKGKHKGKHTSKDKSKGNKDKTADAPVMMVVDDDDILEFQDFSDDAEEECSGRSRASRSSGGGAHTNSLESVGGGMGVWEARKDDNKTRRTKTAAGAEEGAEVDDPASPAGLARSKKPRRAAATPDVDADEDVFGFTGAEVLEVSDGGSNPGRTSTSVRRSRSIADSDDDEEEEVVVSHRIAVDPARLLTSITNTADSVLPKRRPEMEKVRVASPPKPVVVVTKGPWTCSLCTYANAPGSSKCRMCFNRKPSAPAASAPASSLADADTTRPSGKKSLAMSNRR